MVYFVRLRFAEIIQTYDEGDTGGRIDCLNKPVSLTIEPVQLDQGTSLLTHPETSDQNSFSMADLPIMATPQPLQKQVECGEQLNCCEDIVDTSLVNTINICEGEKYTLPDNTLVTETGRFYVTTKNLAGCDTIRFYNINVIKNPATLRLGEDTCLNGGNSPY